jgi:hypothetical protein
MIPRYLSIRLLPLLLAAFTIAMVGPAAADETWIDQFKNTVLFYQQSDPTTDWQPYLDKVATIRAGLAVQ